jgi:hypothetical protein
MAIELSDIGVDLTHRSVQSDREAVIRRAGLGMTAMSIRSSASR